MKHFKLTGILAVSILLGQSSLWAAVYKVDPDHSAVSFKIRHLFSNVQGEFTEFEGTVEYDSDKPETWKAQGTIQAASIDTRVPQRDKHLRSKDFFDVGQFPVISFKTTKVAAATKTSAAVEGLLSVHGVEKPVTLDVTIGGVGKDPWGNVRAGFTATTTVNRKDFGLTWNQALETGALLVGDEVMITLEIEGIAQS